MKAAKTALILAAVSLAMASFASEADARRKRKRKKPRRPKVEKVVPAENDKQKEEDAKQKVEAAKKPEEAPKQGEARKVSESSPPAVSSSPEPKSGPGPAKAPADENSAEKVAGDKAMTAAPIPVTACQQPPVATEPVDDAQRTNGFGRDEYFPVTVGIELGGSFSQVVSKLGSSLSATLEVGYLLPVYDQRIQVLGDLSYVKPRHATKVTDPRLAGGAYRYSITEEELLFTVGGLYRIFPPGTPLNFYGQAGWRMRMQHSNVKGNASGARFGKNDETATEAVGLLLSGGVELTFGPGALAGEIDFAIGDLNHRVTGNSTAGGMKLQVGYHFLF